MEFVEKYISEVQNLVGKIDQQAVINVIDTFWNAYVEEKKIFVFGNGGSAATADHFITDLVKGTAREGKKSFKAFSLTNNTSFITAMANDFSYEDIFVGAMKPYFAAGDIAMGISASGNSENVLKAIEYANKNGGKTIGLVGFDGGKLKNLAQQSILIQSNHYGRVEDINLLVCHIIAYYFMDKIKKL